MDNQRKPSNRKPARYHIDQYRLDHGAYHRARWNLGKREICKEHYWVFPDIKDASHRSLTQFYFGLEEQTKSFVRIRERAQKILNELTSCGKDHPKPAHLSRAKSRFHMTMSLPELSQRWEVDEETIRKRIQSGVLPAIRTSQKMPKSRGGNYRITFEDIMNFEDLQRIVVTSPTPALPQPTTTPNKPQKLGITAVEAAKHVGLSRAHFYRVVQRLKSQNIINPALIGKKGMKFCEADIEKIRDTIKESIAKSPAIPLPTQPEVISD